MLFWIPELLDARTLEAFRERIEKLPFKDGRATLALSLRPLASVGPLSIHGLIGIDDVDSARAVAGARAVVDARKPRGA